jgi:hypothetical protein
VELKLYVLMVLQPLAQMVMQVRGPVEVLVLQQLMPQLE